MSAMILAYTVPMIPHVFHRIWVGGTMPDEFIRTGQTWLEQNPGWTMQHWDESNMPKLKNQAIYDKAPDIVESRLVGRMRSNIARLEILHRFGGVYIDTDFVATNPIPRRYLESSFFLARENETFVNNGIIGSIQGHSFLRKLIKAIPESVATQPGKPSNVTTGPHLLTRLLPKSGIEVIPTEEVYPYSWREAVAHTGTIGPQSWAHHLWAGSRAQVSVLIPWKPGCPYREQSLRFTLEWFKRNAPDSWQIILAEHDSNPFNKAQALREGFAKSFGRIIVVHDSDLFCDGLFDAVDHVERRFKWAVPHHYVHRLTPEASERVLEGEPWQHHYLDTHEKPYRGVVGGGIIVMRRDIFEACPPDNRFTGWGGEDEAWGYALKIVANHGPIRGKHPLIHLWHPPQERMNRTYGSAESKQLVERYRQAARQRSAMLRLIDEHRV